MSDTDTPAAPDPGRALPGPHPHESADFKDWKGNDGLGNPTTGLPEGVEPYRGSEPAPEQS